MKRKVILFSAVAAGAVVLSAIQKHHSSKGVETAGALACTLARSLGRQICWQSAIKSAITIGAVAMTGLAAQSLCKKSES